MDSTRMEHQLGPGKILSTGFASPTWVSRLAPLILTLAVVSQFVFQQASAADDNRLQLLASSRFGTVSPFERAALDAIATGGEVNPQLLSTAGAEPSSLNEPVTFRAEVLEWLLTNPDTQALLPLRGVKLVGVTITGQLDLSYATVKVPTALINCLLPDGIDFNHASLVELSLTGSKISRLNGDGSRISRDLLLSYGFVSSGEVRLHGAIVGGNLDASDAQFLHRSPDAIFADKLRVEGNLLLRYGFEAKNRVSLARATILGDFDCEQGSFSNSGGVALNAGGLTIGGDMLFTEAEVSGELQLSTASISGSLEASRARLLAAGGVALRAYAVSIKGDCRLADATLAGHVILEGADIGRDLSFADAFLFDQGEPPTVTLHNASITRRFRWTGIKTELEASPILDVRSATATILLDDAASWPRTNQLLLQGFHYTALHDDAPTDVASRIDWLRRQPANRFRPQPYDQLASVFVANGQPEAAREVLVSKEIDRGRMQRLSFGEQLWYSLFGPMIGYGYEPWNAFFSITAVILLGAAIFQIGAWAGLMTATKEAECVYENQVTEPQLSQNYPKFNALVYSLDVFTPLTYLHQADYWMPNPTAGKMLKLGPWTIYWGDLLRTYMWFHVMAGWTLTSLFVAGITGLVQH